MTEEEAKKKKCPLLGIAVEIGKLSESRNFCDTSGCMMWRSRLLLCECKNGKWTWMKMDYYCGLGGKP